MVPLNDLQHQPLVLNVDYYIIQSLYHRSVNCIVFFFIFAVVIFQFIMLLSIVLYQYIGIHKTTTITFLNFSNHSHINH
jgi:hypothetical protein